MAPVQNVRFVYQLSFDDLATHQLYFQPDSCDLTGGMPNGNCPDASYGRTGHTNEAINIYGRSA